VRDESGDAVTIYEHRTWGLVSLRAIDFLQMAFFVLELLFFLVWVVW
jgi:hypothetical protein